MQLLFFHADYCPPCKQMQQLAANLTAKNVAANSEEKFNTLYGGNAMARQHHVKRLPCLILLDDDGREQARTEAVQTLEGLRKVFERSES